MADNVAPTRSNLLQRRDQVKLAIRGADLLKRKRDALIGEFFALLKPSLAARRQLGEASREAYFALFLANAWDGPETVSSLALAESETVEIALKVEDNLGVKVQQGQHGERDDERPVSPV